MTACSTSLRPYRSVFTMRFMLMLQYRAAAVAGFGTQCWWGFIKVMVFAAFFHRASARQPLSLPQVVSYIWLGQAFLTLMPWWGDPEITEMVRTGNVSYERLRPLDTYFFWYARATAWTTARMTPRAVLMSVFAVVVIPALGLADWRLRMPAGPESAALFACAMVFAILLSSAILMLVNMLVVVMLTDRGPSALAAQLASFFSGIILPLPFFPDRVQRLLFLQPFAGLMDIPFRIYVGNLTGAMACWGLFNAAAWTFVLAALGHWLMGRVMSRLQVQGG